MLAQVGLAPRVLDLALVVEPVGKGCAVLGDVDDLRRIVLVQAQQEVVQTFGVDLPTHLGVLAALLHGSDIQRRILACLANNAGVKVDAQEVNGRLMMAMSSACGSTICPSNSSSMSSG
jgi:hypothetical protein